MTIVEKFPYACCDQCGWMGRITQLVEGPSDNDEACPECGSINTQWMTSEEYVEALKESGCDDDA